MFVVMVLVVVVVVVVVLGVLLGLVVVVVVVVVVVEALVALVVVVGLVVVVVLWVPRQDPPPFRWGVGVGHHLHPLVNSSQVAQDTTRVTHSTTHRANRLVNRNKMAEDIAKATQHVERANRLTGAKLPRTPHTQDNSPSVRTAEQEPSGPEHRTRNATDRASTPVNSSQVAQDSAHATQDAEPTNRRTGAKWPRTPLA